MNISSLSYKLLLRISLLGLAGFASNTAMACAYIQNDPRENVGSAPISGTYAEPILFCKQSFPDSSLTYASDSDSIVAGGSQVISMANTVQQYPLSNTVNLSGFTPSNLDINLNSGALSINYPKSDGYAGSPSLFNFYTTIWSINQCDSAPRGGNQYELVKKHLRDNPSIFTLVGQISLPQRVDTTQDIVKFKGAQLINRSNPTQKIIADVTLYHANGSNNSTIPTGLFKKYCWLGVGARVEINNIDLKNAGDYDLTIAINVQ